MLTLDTLYAHLQRHAAELNHGVRPLELGGRSFDFNTRRALMGVINLSPDSAYSESICATADEALARGKTLLGQGAELLDLGAESSLPQAQRVSPAEQIERIVPLVAPLREAGAVVSVESYHPEVMEAAGRAGAAVFNLTGSRDEEAVWKLAARYGAALIHCHVQGETVRDVGDFTLEADMVPALLSQFRERIRRAESLGVSRHIIDPGLGFYYANLQDGQLRVTHQLNTFLNTFRLSSLGWPTLNILPHAPEVFGEEHRRAAEPFFAVPALLGGSHILRTHEVDTVARVRRIMEAYTPA